MIVEISAKKVVLDDRITKYAEKKVASLEKYLTKVERTIIRAEVLLKRVDREHGNKYEAEVTLHLPHKKFTATDTTLNVLAALDIVCAKLARDLKNRKDERLQRLPRRPNRV